MTGWRSTGGRFGCWRGRMRSRSPSGRASALPKPLTNPGATASPARAFSANRSGNLLVIASVAKQSRRATSAVPALWIASSPFGRLAMTLLRRLLGGAVDDLDDVGHDAVELEVLRCVDRCDTGLPQRGFVIGRNDAADHDRHLDPGGA